MLKKVIVFTSVPAGGNRPYQINRGAVDECPNNSSFNPRGWVLTEDTVQGELTNGIVITANYII